ncbi:extracellular solute-binding protein [Phytoactinopolyspora alkaliphila]|uniref:Extracellular solute-binding protein n=1 Tax=Phytoactinopolyspora alkaliphila TaxID=1783498 RepID=A0A6N9YKU7_9ACTN|nr:extracellular solute-binding protein [Phytoactinopolyspora alkaliphila]NED95604.1 extracellular solute-binding protein [Phytoactinopolyspora alkaliphila]
MQMRTSIATAGLSIGSLALAACGSSASEDAITFMSGGGTYGDALNEVFLTPYSEESGVTVVEDPTMSYAKVRTQVDAGRVETDMIPAEGYWSVQQCGILLQPLDLEIVDLSGIKEELIQDECGAPLLTYSTAIYYNTETYGEDGPDTCEEFFDTTTFPGSRSVRSAAVPNPLIECALIADGVAPEELYPLDVERAFAKIETIEDDLLFWEAGSDSETQMATGEVDIIMAWNGRAYAGVSQQDASFAGGEGDSFLIYDALVVPVGVENPEVRMELVAFMMQAQRQAELTKVIPYSPAAAHAELSDLPADLEPFLPETNPAMVAGNHVQDQRWWAENADSVANTWQSQFGG